MKKAFIVLIFLILIPSAYSQIINGKIVDINTNAGISFAAVYFSGTSTGTLTDKYGYFKLDISHYKAMPLSISALGYHSVTLTRLSNNKPYLIHLSPKLHELSEVIITAKADKERRKNLQIFKNEFLGTTLNAMSCDIINEYDLILTYNANRDTLRAFASNPLIINNRALGYKITYYLDKFEYSRSKNYLLLTGNYIFTPDTNRLANQQSVFARKRKTAFLGSRMHFFRALWENNLELNGFVVKDSSNEKLAYDKFVSQTDSLYDSNRPKFIRNQVSLLVSYHSVNPQSQILILKDSVYFTEEGYYDPIGIGWQGEMSKQRIADLLPFDYKLK